jgi:DHA2 family multidrug resistance protein-like MFS transporter
MQRWLAFSACVLVALTNEVGGAVLSLSLQDAGAALRSSTAGMQVVMTLSKLLFGAFMLLGGVLGDARGRRRVLVIGAGLIVVSSLLASVSTSTAQLALARSLDGLGNAAVGPLALALVMSLFPAEQRPRALGLFLGLSAVGVAAGPLLAGVVIQAFGWRAGYGAPAIVAALGGLGVWLFAPETRGTERRRIDGVGGIVVAVALLALVFGVIGASNRGWGNPRVLQSLAVGAGALLAFVWWERRVADPLLDPSLFRSRPLSAALVCGTIVALAMGGVILPLLYFFQRVQGLAPVASVLRILPLVIVAAACASTVGRLLSRHGPRPVLIAGLVLLGTGCAGFAFLRPDTPYPHMLVALALIGVGNIAVITPVTDVVLESVPPERAGTASALNSAAMQVGSALGAAILTSVFLEAARAAYFTRLAPTGLAVEKIREITKEWREAVAESTSTGARMLLPRGLEGQFEEAYRQAFASGVARVFLVAALLALACAALVWVAIPARAVPRADELPSG